MIKVETAVTINDQVFFWVSTPYVSCRIKIGKKLYSAGLTSSRAISVRVSD